MVLNNDNISGNLPHDIMINILKRLPTKSVVRFKSVAKDWYHLFKSPFFISLHLHHHRNNNNNLFLLLHRIPQSNHHSESSSSSSSSSSSPSSCLIGPDFKVHNPRFFDFASPEKIIGSCNGLLCVRDSYRISIWNPATREIRQVPETLLDIKSFYYFGFGFSPTVNDYKVVRICVSDDVDGILVLDNVRVTQAEVYSLTTGSWKEIDATILQTLYLMSSSVTANGVMFWQAITVDPDLEGEFVVSFDIGREMFTLLKDLPSPLSTYSTHSRTNVLAVHNNNLAIFHHFINRSFDSSAIDLWVLEDEKWVKQYSVGPFSRILYPLSIWRDEMVCREELPGRVDVCSRVETVLSLFNPYGNELKKLPAERDHYYYVPFNYEESLVPVANVQHEE